MSDNPTTEVAADQETTAEETPAPRKSRRQLLEREGEVAADFLETLLDIADGIAGNSFCALGDGAASPIVSSLKYVRDEYIRHVTEQGCPFDPHRSTLMAEELTS